MTDDTIVSEELSFKRIDDPSVLPGRISTEKTVYVVPSLSADFFLLFPTARAIVTTAGSPLSHLAILAREHNIPVFLAQNVDLNSLDSEGRCTLIAQ